MVNRQLNLITEYEPGYVYPKEELLKTAKRLYKGVKPSKSLMTKIILFKNHSNMVGKTFTFQTFPLSQTAALSIQKSSEGK